MARCAAAAALLAAYPLRLAQAQTTAPAPGPLTVTPPPTVATASPTEPTEKPSTAQPAKMYNYVRDNKYGDYPSFVGGAVSFSLSFIIVIIWLWVVLCMKRVPGIDPDSGLDPDGNKIGMEEEDIEKLSRDWRVLRNVPLYPKGFAPDEQLTRAFLKRCEERKKEQEKARIERERKEAYFGKGKVKTPYSTIFGSIGPKNPASQFKDRPKSTTAASDFAIAESRAMQEGLRPKPAAEAGTFSVLQSHHSVIGIQSQPSAIPPAPLETPQSSVMPELPHRSPRSGKKKPKTPQQGGGASVAQSAPGGALSQLSPHSPLSGIASADSVADLAEAVPAVLPAVSAPLSPMATDPDMMVLSTAS